MDDKTKEDFIKLFNQGFEEVVMPQLEEIIRQDMATKSDIDRLEGKLDRVLDKNIEQENRLGRIEPLPTVAHELKLKK